jgi:hypothetical protein
MVQRHKSRTSQNPNAPREPRGKKREVGDMDAMKKQGKQIAKMGKRGQEKKSIDASVFPTLGQSDSFIAMRFITRILIWCNFRYRTNRGAKVSQTTLLSLHASEAPRLAYLCRFQSGGRIFLYFHSDCETLQRASTSTLLEASFTTEGVQGTQCNEDSY